jgi:hypothetical protein
MGERRTESEGGKIEREGGRERGRGKGRRRERGMEGDKEVY